MNKFIVLLISITVLLSCKTEKKESQPIKNLIELNKKDFSREKFDLNYIQGISNSFSYLL